MRILRVDKIAGLCPCHLSASTSAAARPGRCSSADSQWSPAPSPRAPELSTSSPYDIARHTERRTVSSQLRRPEATADSRASRTAPAHAGLVTSQCAQPLSSNPHKSAATKSTSSPKGWHRPAQCAQARHSAAASTGAADDAPSTDCVAVQGKLLTKEKRPACQKLAASLLAPSCSQNVTNWSTHAAAASSARGLPAARRPTAGLVPAKLASVPSQEPHSFSSSKVVARGAQCAVACMRRHSSKPGTSPGAASNRSAPSGRQLNSSRHAPSGPRGTSLFPGAPMSQRSAAASAWATAGVLSWCRSATRPRQVSKARAQVMRAQSAGGPSRASSAASLSTSASCKRAVSGAADTALASSVSMGAIRSVAESASASLLRSASTASSTPRSAACRRAAAALLDPRLMAPELGGDGGQDGQGGLALSQIRAAARVPGKAVWGADECGNSE